MFPRRYNFKIYFSSVKRATVPPLTANACYSHVLNPTCLSVTHNLFFFRAVGHFYKVLFLLPGRLCKLFCSQTLYTIVTKLQMCLQMRQRSVLHLFIFCNFVTVLVFSFSIIRKYIPAASSESENCFCIE